MLLSLDLEDLGSEVPGTDRYRGRVPAMAERFLAFLGERGLRCTFFSTGDVALRHPEVIGMIAGAGHEIASHGTDHVPLDQLTPTSFKADLERSREVLRAAGADEVVGFRAPMMSLTRDTSWAYEVLAESGFRYSSSVLPAHNPLYGWPGAARDCWRAASGIWEIPFTVGGLGRAMVPFAGGMYLRVLPRALIRWLLRKEHAREYIVSYLHPYDFDAEQERFYTPVVENNPLYRWMLYRNRASALDRVDDVLAASGAVVRYIDFVQTTLAAERSG